MESVALDLERFPNMFGFMVSLRAIALDDAFEDHDSVAWLTTDATMSLMLATRAAPDASVAIWRGPRDQDWAAGRIIWERAVTSPDDVEVLGLGAGSLWLSAPGPDGGFELVRLDPSHASSVPLPEPWEARTRPRFLVTHGATQCIYVTVSHQGAHQIYRRALGP